MKKLLISSILFAIGSVAVAETLGNLRDGDYPCGPEMVRIEGTLNAEPVVSGPRTYFNALTVGRCQAMPNRDIQPAGSDYTGHEVCDYYPAHQGLRLNYRTEAGSGYFNHLQIGGRHFIACGRVYNHNGQDYLHYIHPGDVAGWLFIQSAAGVPINAATPMERY